MSWDSVVQEVTVSDKGWVVIPKAIREKFGIEKGDKVAIVALGGTISIIPVPQGDPVKRARGLLGTAGPSSTEALLADRRWELEQEERDLPPPPQRDTSQERRIAESEDRYTSPEQSGQ